MTTKDVMTKLRTYRGHGESTSDAHVVEVSEDGEVVGLLRHHVRHSPTGFSWGYAGSGPAELARCLLIDALGNAAVCPSCAGTGQQVWSPVADSFVPWTADTTYPHEVALSICPCGECGGDRIARVVQQHYQAFKFAFVAHWPKDGGWQITQQQVVEWLNERMWQQERA